MSLIVGCEFSGIVRDAFDKQGVSVCSVDLLPTEKPGLHYMEDLLKFCHRNVNNYTGLIAHPPCTHLAVSGARWFKGKEKEQKEALEFVRALMELPFPFICIENPVSIISSHIRKPDQIIHPWMFGHGETKATCLWLKGFPKLISTNVVSGRENRVHRMPPSVNRWKERSRTFTGIAEAMAQQWAHLFKGK